MTTFDLDLVIQASRCIEQEEGVSERLRFDLKKIQSKKDSINTEDVCVIQKYNEIVEQY
ncbi:hypothetical protein K9M48_00200 [Candidatus Gracilibacteria bacterium]|nr:hypothetical protein [Candidatus Gracilibacteria bacterium]